MFLTYLLPHGSWLLTLFSSHCVSSVSAGVSLGFALPHPSILSLVALPILPPWLLASQHFIKPIQVTNLHSIQMDYPIAEAWKDILVSLCEDSS